MTDDRRLGRGLSALLGEDMPAAGAAGVQLLPVERLHPGRFQPRRHFDEDGITALAESIAAQGVLQPLLVRRSPTMLDGFEILAGERRWRAAQQAKLREVPVIVRDVADRDALEFALVENMQREDLLPLEEARGFQRLIDEFRYTQEQLAARVGKSRSHVANMIRLLALPDPVKHLLDGGSLSAGHARALLTAKDPEALARAVMRSGLNVRQTEAAAKSSHRAGARGTLAARDPDIVALERALGETLGLKVAIQFNGEAGTLTIHCRSLDQFDAVLTRLRTGT